MSISKVKLPNNTEEDIKAKYLIQSTSADAVSKEFVTRTTTEDASVATIQKIYGNTVKWNQLNRVQNNSATITEDTIIDNKVTGYTYHREANHKYLYRVRLTTLTANDAVYLMGSNRTVGIKNNELYATIYENGSTTQDRNNNFSLRSYGTGTISWTDLCIYDLTEMYGAGNEPTIAEFEATYPEGYSPYTTTTLLSVNATAIQSKDSNSNIIGNCDLNIPTLTGKLNGAGSSVVIFPDGLKKVGTVYDEIVGNKAIKRVGSVDLGTLSFTYETTYVTDTPVFYARVIGRKTGSAHLLSALYYVAGPSRTYLEGTNMAMASHNSSSSDAVDFTNSSYSNWATFKTAMTGVILYYELATPEEYILDNALQLQYPVVAGGTEMVLPTTGTAPMKMDVIYGNAADATSNLSSNFISVDSMKAFLNNLGTQMGGTWNIQYNNGKFEFTFSSS